ncbi:MAG: type II toxin-antitoxin system HicA family toxin [Pyrinomonadaceae bacterium]
MGKDEKLLSDLLRGRSDANIEFEDLCQLLRSLGFDERISGSHHIFRRTGIEARINLQRDKRKAKVYQVRQVRAVIVKHGLAGESDDA